MTDPVDIKSARWARASRPSDLAPIEALHAALADIEAIQPQHVIVLMAREHEDGTIYFHQKQAGSFGPFAQRGLLSEAIQDWNE